MDKGVTTRDVLMAVVFFLLVLTLLAVGVRSWWTTRGHGQAVAQFATTRGLTYVPRDDRQVRAYGFPFGVGRHRRAENIINGTLDGRLVMAYDYVFDRAEHGRLRRSSRFGIVLMRLPQPLATLQVVERAHPVDDSPDLATVRVGDPEFDERFEVRTSDSVLTGLVLGEQSRKALLACNHVALRIHGSEVMSWKPGRLDDLDPHLQAMCALADDLSLGDDL